MKTTRSFLFTFLAALALSALAPAAIIPLNFAGGGMSGANEVPANASTGTGGEIGAGITFDDVTKMLTVNVGWGAANGFTDLSASVTAAHIHLAAPGVNGGVVIPLTVVGSTINVTTAPLNATNEAALLAGNLYVNVHTLTYPGGEIRGQLVRAIVWTTATVSGPADVSTAGVLVGAMNVGVGSTARTINGITFAVDSGAVGSPLALGSATVQFSFGIPHGDFLVETTVGGNAEYAAALDDARYDDPPTATSGTVTLGGLVAGRAYEVQLWIADSRGCCNARTRTVDGVTTNANGPQIARGTFTANASTQTITIAGVTGSYGPQLNLLQLRDVSPTVTIAPLNSTVGELQSVTFTATPGEAGLTFQWFKNGSPIPGATGSAYTINQANIADNGATFQVRVTRPADGAVGLSAVAVLTVIPGPTVLSVAVSGDRLTLTVTYSKPMGASALIPGSYTVTGGSSPSVTSAALNGAVVSLTLGSALAANTQYTLTTTGVTDPDSNLLIPNPTSKQLFAYQPLVTSAAGDTSAGSLRQVVANAPTGTTITFDPTLAGETITLSGELSVDASRSVTLDASALSGGVTLSGNNATRLATVTAGASLTLKNLTLTRGNGASGGAITSAGTVVAEDCTFTANATTGAGYDGGAIFSSSGSVLTLTRCTFTGNSAYEGGGVRSTNAALTATNCTFSSNNATIGGACSIADGGPAAVLTHLTISGNNATGNAGGTYGGGGIFLTGKTVTLTNSIIAGNNSPTGPDLDTFFGNSVTSAGGNLIGNNTRLIWTPLASDQIGTGAAPLVARLAPLAGNGGPTQTMALLAGSPALDKGVAVAAATDQRGFTRSRDGDVIAGALPDSGAYEAQVAPVGSIGFNFVGGGTHGPGGTLTSTEVAGLFPQANWKNLSTDYDGSTTGTAPNAASRNDATGASISGLKLWWDAPNVWSRTGTPTTPNEKLLWGYLDSTGVVNSGTNLYTTANQPFFAIASLPAALTLGGYRVLVYADGESNDHVSEFWLASNRGQNLGNVSSETDLTTHRFRRDNTDGATFTEVPASSTADLGANTPVGNVIRFDVMTESGFTVRSEEVAGLTLLSENFNAGNGGFTVSTPLPYAGPWTYNAGSGSWIENGQDPINGHANTSTLSSPTITLASSGEVKLTFVHRHSFEDGSWDGGQVRVSINGAAYAAVPGAAFSQGGYNGTVLAGSSSELHGQPAFVETSAGHGAGTFFTSIASLGTLNAGTTISVQFFAGNDTNTAGATPNWEIDSVSLVQSNYPRADLNAVQIVRNEIVVVTTAADELDPVGTLGAGVSLREAIRDAAPGSGIVFDSTLSGATLALDSEIVLGKSVTIDASSLPGGLTLSGGGAHRIFRVSSGQTVALRGLTLSGNRADNSIGGGAIFNNGGTLTLNHTIAAGNTRDGNPDNISGGFTGVNNLTSGDPLLAPLGNYGGPTQTMPPLPGSPALDAAVGSAFTTDQRGFPITGTPDIGAVEIGTVTVTTATDELDPAGTPGTGVSLREALLYSAPGEKVIFDPILTGGTVFFSSVLGEIVLGKSVTIDASALTGGLTLDGGPGTNRIFTVSSGQSVVLKNLTLTGGNGAGAARNGDGGAVLNLGTLTLERCTLSGNTAGTTPGSPETGGAIYSHTGASLTLKQCTLFGNQCISNRGGAVNSRGTLGLIHCTISGNTARFDGGGVRSDGPTTLTNTIIAGNTLNAGLARDLYVGTTTLTRVGANIVPTFGNDGGAVISGPAPLTTDPLLAPLDNYGGPTKTMALKPTSPARNAAGVISEVQLVSLSGSTSGTFTLTFNGATTTSLAFNATAPTVENALNALATIGGAGGSVAVTRAGNVFTVTFGGTLAGANQPALTTAVSGGTVATIATILDFFLATADQRGFPIVGGTPDIGAYEAGTLNNYNAWIWETLPATATIAQHATAFDFDSDGVTNGNEWLALTNPGNSTSYLRITQIARVGTNLNVTFPTVAGRTYTLETTTDFVTWTPAAGPATTGTGNPVTVTIGPVNGSPKFFVRARVGP